MATVRIGDWGDQHYDYHSDSQYRDDLDYLLNTLDVDLMLYGGDTLDGDSGVPHASESLTRDWFDNIVQNVSGATDSHNHYVMGNHDVPVPHFQEIASEYLTDGYEQVRMPKKLTPIDGVRVLLIDTEGFGDKQAGESGLGENYERVPYYQLEWAREQVLEAQDNGEIVIVFGHAPITPVEDTAVEAQQDGPYGNHKTERYSSNSMAYEVPQNYLPTQFHLRAGADIVYISHHDFHTGFEVNDTLNGVINHIWQDHWARAGSNAPNTFGYLDVDTSDNSIKYTSVESSDKSETVIVEKQITV